MARYQLLWDGAEACAEHLVEGDLVVDMAPPGVRESVRVTVRRDDVPTMLAALDCDPHEDAAAVLSVYAAAVAHPSLLDWLTSLGIRTSVSVVRRPPRTG